MRLGEFDLEVELAADDAAVDKSVGAPPEDWFPQELANRLSERMAGLKELAPSQPTDAMPSLGGAGDDMDLRSATVLNVQSCRWLEYLAWAVAEREAAAGLLAARLETLQRVLKHRYKGKVEAYEEADLTELNQLTEQLAIEQAHVVLLRALVASQEKVRAAASRTISALTKSNPNKFD